MPVRNALEIILDRQAAIARRRRRYNLEAFVVHECSHLKFLLGSAITHTSLTRFAYPTWTVMCCCPLFTAVVRRVKFASIPDHLIVENIAAPFVTSVVVLIIVSRHASGSADSDTLNKRKRDPLGVSKVIYRLMKNRIRAGRRHRARAHPCIRKVILRSRLLTHLLNLT